ncbi:MAG: GTP 3',8-cyclase MoaA, partial [Ruminococcaceae bacterium]|nr:GTP 3',8-cyclase MoaA [Oscillospiraceae bacterium]
MLDRFGRNIDYMRVSITDRCNLRCRYCMPEGVELVPMREILTYEEIGEICAVAAALGVRKLKVTGGEPLVRLGCAELIRMLKAIPGVEQVTLTTNGVLLARYLPELLDAGLDAVNVSLDTLDRERYASITGRDELDAVLSGVDAALASGLRLKLNAVLQRGVNDDEWFSLAGLARDRALDVRFIELMPIGSGREIAGVENAALRAELLRRYPALEEDASVHGNGPAVYVRVPGWTGSVGFISAMHGKFCDRCNRLRLTAQGRVKPCLCYGESVDLMPLLRGGARGAEREALLRQALEDAVASKPAQHCFEAPERVTEKARMAGI